MASDCTSHWQYTLDIDSLKPKPMSGDTFSGYAIIGFRKEPGLKLRIEGAFPKSRFISFESYQGKRKRHVDSLYDFEIEPDKGSLNPYREGVDQNTPQRSYSLEAVFDEKDSVSSNTLLFSPDDEIHSIFYRVYSPSNDVVLTQEDLPKIYVLDSKTGESRACPSFLDTVYHPGPIKVLLHFVQADPEIKFRESNLKNGANHAIPYYIYAVNKVRHGDISLIRFKAPTFFNSQSGVGPFLKMGDVRYWSFCTQNFKISETLNCLPDFRAKIDKEGWITLAIGMGNRTREIAGKLGFNFLEDRRKKDQKVLGYAYRNLVPNETFQKEKMYQGDYYPKGEILTFEEFENLLNKP